MIKLTKSDYIDCEKYLSDLRSLGFIYVDPSILQDRINRMKPAVETKKHLCTEIMLCKSGHVLYTLDKRNVLSYLKTYENCPSNFFIMRGKKEESLDASKVLAPLLERGLATEFLEMYVEYKSEKSIVERLEKIKSRLSESDEVGYNGKPLSKLYFRYEEISNLRLSTKDDNVQGIPKQAVDCFVAPRGYVIVSGDFKQSDLRIAYSMMIRDQKNVDVMMSFDDKYEGLCKILQGDAFSPEDFKEHRDIYKINSLAPIYGATSAKTMVGTKYIHQARNFLKSSPVYQEYIRRIKKRIDLKLPLKVTSYFGNSESISTLDVVNYEGKDPMNFALNSPIQTGTSEIVKAVTNNIMERFEELGFTSENGSIYSYLNRHDESLFLVRSDLLEYSYIFQESQYVQVDNWIPLEVDFDFTRQYITPDKEINKVAKSYFKTDCVEVPSLNFNTEESYIPTKDLMELSVGSYKIDGTDETVLAFYDFNRQKCSFEVVKNATVDKLVESVIYRASTSGNVMKKNDCDCILIYTSLVTRDTTIFKGYTIRLTGNYSSDLFNNTSIIAEFGAYNLLKSKGIEVPMSDRLTYYKDFLNQLVRNGSVFE